LFVSPRPGKEKEKKNGKYPTPNIKKWVRGESKIYNMNILVNRASRRLIFPTMYIGTLNTLADSRGYQRWQHS